MRAPHVAVRSSSRGPYAALLPGVLALCAACGFPRPPDVEPDGGTPDGGGSCERDEDCGGGTPACLAGHCVTAADACREGDGARIVFLSNRDGNAEVFRAYGDGSTALRLTSYDPPEISSFVTPSPDGKAIAFVHHSDVFVMAADGSDAVNVTMSAALEDRVEWSPDGTMLAVGTTDGSGMTTAYFMMKNGSAPVQAVAAGGVSRDPSWLPNSSGVVFGWSSPSQSAVYVKRLAPPGGAAEVVVSVQLVGTVVSVPRVSPSGLVLAFVLTQGTGKGAFIAPVTGGSTQRLSTTGINDHEVVWSHDASRAALVRGNGTDRAIWVVNADGTGLMNLTPGSHPRWSPADRYLLFETIRDGNREVYRMDSDGSHQVNLSNTAFDDLGGEWLSCSGG